VRRVYSFYGRPSSNPDRKLEEVEEGARADTQTARAWYDEMADYPERSYILPPFPSLDEGRPRLEFDILALAAWGGSGGDPFQDVTYSSVLSQERLVEMQIRGGSRVDRIRVKYESAETGSIREFERGGGGGTDDVPLALQAGEFIQSVAGRSGASVDRLTLTTTRGQTPDWPQGAGGGDPFTSKVPEDPSRDSVLLGFQGRSGAELDLLSPVVCTFSDASWHKVPGSHLAEDGSASPAANDAEEGGA
jgi:hypothetical protein